MSGFFYVVAITPGNADGEANIAGTLDAAAYIATILESHVYARNNILPRTPDGGVHRQPVQMESRPRFAGDVL